MRHNPETKSRKGIIIALVAVLLLSAAAAWYFLDGPGRTRFTVSFDSNGGSAAQTLSVKKGKSAELPVITKDCYTFDGWYLGETKAESPFTPTGDVTLTAKWIGDTVKITFDPNGGAPGSEISYVCGTPLELPAAPTLAKNHFTGWEDSTGKEYTEGSVYEGPDLTLYAQWEENTFTVTFDSKGGTDVAPITLKEGEKLEELPESAKEDHRFICWETESGKEITEDTELPCEDITLYAKWEKTTYIVSFDVRDGSPEYDPVNMRDGQAIRLPSDLTKQGYVFVCWETKAGEKVADKTILPCEDITLYARWEKNKFTVSFDSKGGSKVSAITVYEGDKLPKLPTPTKTGYSFICWEDKNGKTIAEGALLACENITLYAKWEKSSFTVSFDSRGGSKVDPKVIQNGQKLPKLPIPEKKNCQFVCWEDKNGTPIYEGALLACEDITLYAKWKKIAFTVSFDSNGGSKSASITVRDGQQLPKLPTPVKAGYRFVCWEDKNGMPIYEGALLTCEDITLYAKWEKAE